MSEARTHIKYDLPFIDKYRDLIISIADSYEFDPALIAAIMSRESGGGRHLGKGSCPPLTGDRGHGRGLMQIDDRYHKAFISIPDLWKQPSANISYGCHILKENLIHFIDKYSGESLAANLRAATAAYNTGTVRVGRAIDLGKDPDAYTTGRDYSADVFERASLLRAKGYLGKMRSNFDIENQDARRPNEERERNKWIQESLNKILDLGLRVDGIYGPATRSTVMKFQALYGLTVDGVCGPRTEAKIKEVLNGS